MTTKVIVVSSVILTVGLVFGAFSQAQNPPVRQPGKTQRTPRQITNPNAAPSQNRALNSQQEVVRLSPKDLPQNPLRVGINNAIQKGLQQAKPNPAATLTLNSATKDTPQNGSPSKTPNGASNIVTNTPPSTTQNGSRNANVASNGPPPVDRATNPNQSATAPTGPVPPAIKSGIAALISSKASLENSGSKWGGHKEKAIQLIDQALKACGQTTTSDNGGTNSNTTDGTAAMQAALAQLTTAQSDFKNAKNAWGGRRDQALPLINQALSEVQSGIDFAKSHNAH